MDRLQIELGSSYLQKLLYAGYLVLGLLIALHWQMAIWLWAVVIGAIALTVVVLRSRHTQVLALSETADGSWQLVIDGYNGDEIWQAQLDRLTQLPFVVVFEFWVVQPMPRALTVTVYFDQLDRHALRELKLRSRFV